MYQNDQKVSDTGYQLIMLLHVLHHKGLGEPYSKTEKVQWPHYTSLKLGLLLRDWHFFIFYYDPLTSQASSLQLV